MVVLQSVRKTSSLISAYFSVCVLIQVARSQQPMTLCVNDVTSEDSCYNERKVICDNYTDATVRRDCLPGTVNTILYRDSMYTVSHGSNLSDYFDNSSEVILLQLCHEKAIEVTVSDLAYGTKCTSKKDKYIAHSFQFSCNNLLNVLSSGLTIVFFERIDNPSCSCQKSKFVVIDTRDVNECHDGTYNCSQNAQCNDEKCGYSCSCQIGYFMEDDNYTCAPVDCGPLPPVRNGHIMISGSGTVFQSLANYACDNGYNLVGVQNRTCESNTVWSGEEPECKAVDCGNLSAVVNGKVETVATTFGSIANHSCNNGYELIGPSTRICLASGSWSDTDPLCKAVDCGNVDPPSNGDVNAPETTFQAVATYSCISGYSLVGDSIQFCQANGSWSGQIPQCNPVDCGTLPQMHNGYTITVTNTTVFQSVAHYFCDNGYYLDGHMNRTCESTAKWSGDEPVCKAVDCEHPGTPDNGQVEVSTTTFESEVSYACSDGYYIDGISTRFCQANGTWSGYLPSCRIVDCGGLTSPLNGNVSMDGTVYESVAMYMCYDGYILMGERYRLCLENGTWSHKQPLCELVNCGPPPAPTNGNVNVTSPQPIFQSIAVYSCNAGFMLVGENSRMCEALGAWTGQTPTCTGVDCGPLTAPKNGTINVPITTFEGVAFYNCSHGYNLIGVSRRMCQANATWSNEEPMCEAVECGPLSVPQNTMANVTTTTFPSTAVYSCEDGYELNGPATRTCQPNGSWSRLETSCAPIDCGPPPPLENGQIDILDQITTFQSVARYKCIDGYILEGEASRTCKADRSWSGIQPVCRAIDCGQLSSPDNGYIDGNETSFHSKVTYFCANGYVLHGQQERECLANGSWSNEVPKCQPIDCGTLEQPVGGSVVPLSSTLSSVATYNCTSGYTLSGNRTRQCQPDGTWSGEMPQCIPVDCGQLEDPVDGQVIATATTFGTVASYMCRDGYVLMNGSTTRTCQANAHWSGTRPTCIDVCMTEEHGCDLNTSDCISGHGNVPQRCKCKDGFQTKNDACVRACREDGGWPQTAAGCIFAIPCLKDYKGNITRRCGEDGVWQNPDNSTCENIAFINFRNEVEELFETEANDENIVRVLDLVERLDRNVDAVNLTSNDLELAVDILNSTVAFLTQHLNNGGSDYSNESVAVVGTMDKLLNNDMLALYEESNISLGEILLQSSEGYVDYLASALKYSDTAMKTINMTNIKLEALVLSSGDDEVVSHHYYPQQEPIPPGCHDILRILGLEPTYTPRVKIPYQLIRERAKKSNSTQVPAGNAIIKNIEQLLPLDRGLERPVTSILSSQISGDKLDRSMVLQDEPVTINFTIKDLYVSANESAKCVFWKYTNNGRDGHWSSEGVTTKILDNGVVQCNSTHLTSFTVIVAINDIELHPAYEYLTYIGVGVSLVCLFMTIIFFLSERKTLFTRVHYFVHLNLAIALFSAYLIFAIGTHFGANKNVPCAIVAALLHFLFLAAFCWMLCEGVMLYLMLVVVFSSLSKKWWFFLILGWGPPVIFVAAGYTYGAFRGGYADINTCWLANGGTRWFFIGPMIAIIVINVVFLVIVIGSLCKNGSKDARKQIDEKGKNVQLVINLVKASIILLPLLGATWVFGLFALDEASSYVFGTLFIVCSSLQGLFIFIFHVLRSERIWGRIKKKYGLFGSTTQSQSITRQSTFRSSRNTSLILDKKENGVKKFDSYKPHCEDTNSGAVIMEDDGESDGNDSSEPVNLERQEQDDKPDAVSSDSNHTSVAMSPSPAVGVRDNMQ